MNIYFVCIGTSMYFLNMTNTFVFLKPLQHLVPQQLTCIINSTYSVLTLKFTLDDPHLQNEITAIQSLFTLHSHF